MRKYALCLITLLSGPLAGQSIGIVPLKLGDTQEAVLSKLREYYVVDTVLAATGVYFVDEKASLPQKHLGSVVFAGGRLRIVGRSWNPDQADTHSFAQAVIRLVSTRRWAVMPGRPRRSVVSQWQQF